MPATIAPILARLADGENLSLQEMAATIEQIIGGDVPETEIGLLLTALRIKGETAAELAGAATALRRHMTPIRSRHALLIDTCGTGGDGSRTFNISTAAALVTAAAGVPVAKHGNRAFTSRSGSADVLRELGVNVAAEVPVVERCLDKLGICFCFAPLFHGATARVTEVRKRLGTPTIFNLLGPLTNPASAPFQLVGVSKPHLVPVLAEALALLGARRAVVVCGAGPLDEVTISGPTQVVEVGQASGLTLGQADPGASAEGRVRADPRQARGLTYELRQLTWKPADFGLSESPLDALVVDGPTESAALIRRVLAGEPGPARDIVVANAAAALWTAGRHGDLKSAAQAAAGAINTGAAAALVQRLAQETNQP